MPTKAKAKSTKPQGGRLKKTLLPAASGLARGRGSRQLEIRHWLGFNRPLFARLLVTSERNLASIEAGKPASAAVAKSIVEVRRLYAALAEVVDPDTIGEWMKTPNKAFDGLKPLEVIERGEADRIWNMIYEMRSGAIL